MFDPCGTRRVEGEDIIARLADHLELDDDTELKEALLMLIELYRKREEARSCNEGCGCGD